MALADILTPDGDVQQAKMVLTRTYHIVAEAASEYAKASLGAADSALSVAMQGGPCAAAYTAYSEIGKYNRLARLAVENTADVAGLLLALNESDDDAANEAYADHLIDMGKTNEVSVMLEGASRRLEMINRALPKNPQPGARFDATIFSAQEGAQEG